MKEVFISQNKDPGLLFIANVALANGTLLKKKGEKETQNIML